MNYVYSFEKIRSFVENYFLIRNISYLKSEINLQRTIIFQSSSLFNEQFLWIY